MRDTGMMAEQTRYLLAVAQILEGCAENLKFYGDKATQDILYDMYRLARIIKITVEEAEEEPTPELEPGTIEKLLKLRNKEEDNAE